MISLDTVSIALWTIFMLISIPSGFFFLRNREIYPIKGRFPEYVFILYMLRLLISFISEAPYLIENSFTLCFVQSIFFFYTGVSAFFVYNYRMLRLLFSYSITENIAQLEGQAIQSWQESWYTKNRRLTKPSLFKRIALSLSAFYFLVIITVMAVEHNCTTSGARLYTIALFACCLPQLIVTATLAYKISRFKSDAFFIQTELKITLVVVILTFTFLGFTYIVTTKNSVDSKGPVSILTSLNGLGMVLVMIVYPLYQSEKEKRLIAARGEIVLKRLDEFLAIPEGFSSFLEYLKTEFSAENLYFYWDVKTFKQSSLTNSEILKEQALSIFHRFLGPSAVCQVNLPSGMADTVYEKIGEIPIQGPAEPKDLQCFAVAEKEIYDLMATDSFFRFERTNEYQTVKKRIIKDMSMGGSQAREKPTTVGSKGSKSLRDLADRLVEGEGDFELKQLRLLDDTSGRHLLTPSKPGSPKNASPARSESADDDKLRDLDASGHSSPSSLGGDSPSNRVREERSGDAHIPPIIIEENQQLLDADVDDDEIEMTPSRLDSPSHRSVLQTPSSITPLALPETPKENVFVVI